MTTRGCVDIGTASCHFYICIVPSLLQGVGGAERGTNVERERSHQLGGVDDIFDVIALRSEEVESEGGGVCAVVNHRATRGALVNLEVKADDGDGEGHGRRGTEVVNAASCQNDRAIVSDSDVEAGTVESVGSRGNDGAGGELCLSTAALGGSRKICDYGGSDHCQNDIEFRRVEERYIEVGEVQRDANQRVYHEIQ